MANANSVMPERVGRLRWSICGLLFLAMTVNYVDRQVIGILKPTLQHQLHWSEIDYSNIIFAFQLAYAMGYLFVGRLIDRLGTRKGFSLSVLLWSCASMAHAAVSSVLGFATVRFVLGLGEGGSFPAAVKTVSEWFPKKERALAIGLFNAGTNVGAIVTPLILPWIVIHFGWRRAFIATGSLSMSWLILWLWLYRPPRQHKRLSRAELAYIEADGGEPTLRVPWGTLLKYRQMWAIALGKFMTDPFWWLYLFWIPDFLNKAHGVTLLNIGLPLVAIYLAADVGSIAGGWLSSTFIAHGWSVNRARKTAMFICALGVVPIFFASRVSGLWSAVALVGLAAASHQGWSANMYTLASDLFPRRTVASVVGVGGMAGSVAGMLIAEAVGRVLQWTGSYSLIFAAASGAYLTALLVIHLLVPKLKPAPIDETA
ncbi:MAG TPA: MFS transporter [Terriglobales bacterium]|nr:MFS transporter [Terriglobales bacterium]